MGNYLPHKTKPTFLSLLVDRQLYSYDTVVLQGLTKRPGPNPHADMDKMPLPDPSRAEQMIADLVAQDPEPPLVINRAGADFSSSSPFSFGQYFVRLRGYSSFCGSPYHYLTDDSALHLYLLGIRTGAPPSSSGWAPPATLATT